MLEQKHEISIITTNLGASFVEEDGFLLRCCVLPTPTAWSHVRSARMATRFSPRLAMMTTPPAVRQRAPTFDPADLTSYPEAKSAGATHKARILTRIGESGECFAPEPISGVPGWSGRGRSALWSDEHFVVLLAFSDFEAKCPSQLTASWINQYIALDDLFSPFGNRARNCRRRLAHCT